MNTIHRIPSDVAFTATVKAVQAPKGPAPGLCPPGRGEALAEDHHPRPRPLYRSADQRLPGVTAPIVFSGALAGIPAMGFGTLIPGSSAMILQRVNSVVETGIPGFIPRGR
jgi:hypothetical protein